MSLHPTLEYQIGGQPNCLRVTWILGSGETGDPASVGEYPDRTVQVDGNFGSGASVTIEGSNDLPDESPTWAALSDPQGAPILKAAAGLSNCEETPLIVRPKVTGGDVNTSLTIRILCRRPRV